MGAIPWAALAPHPALVAWLDRQPPSPGHTGLVIGCGLGDDAQQVSRHGYRVTACDPSPTAIDRCRERFPGSAVDYRVADLLAQPCRWETVFDLVVEIRTLQSLPPSQRADAASAMARTVRPGGRASFAASPGGRRRTADHTPVAAQPPGVAGLHRRRHGTRSSCSTSQPSPT